MPGDWDKVLVRLCAVIGLVVITCLNIICTALDDRTLHDEPGSYKVYARWVCYRLLPGVLDELGLTFISSHQNWAHGLDRYRIFTMLMDSLNHLHIIFWLHRRMN